MVLYDSVHRLRGHNAVYDCAWRLLHFVLAPTESAHCPLSAYVYGGSQVAAFFLAFKGVENIAHSDGPLSLSDLFSNSIFRNIVISILATLGLYILASLIFVCVFPFESHDLSCSR